MTPRKHNFNTWREPQDEREACPIATISSQGHTVVTPLYLAPHENGHDAVVVAVAEKHVGSDGSELGVWAPNLLILVPGMCGHYGCGGTVEVSLN